MNSGGERAIIAGSKFPCPYCGNNTFDVEPWGSFEICEICGWEDDSSRFHLTELKMRHHKRDANAMDSVLPGPGFSRLNFQKMRGA